MPLSTVLGAQSLVQPAVCTTATRPASPYTGQAIYDTTLAQTLVYNGSAFVVQTGGLVRVGGGALSGSSTAFTSVFSATYEAYKIIVSNGNCSGAAYIALTFGSTTTGYKSSQPGSVTTTGAYASSLASGTSYAAVGFTTSGNFGSDITVLNPQLAKYTHTSSSLGFVDGNNGASHNGVLENSTQYTGFTLAPSSGTFTGTVNIYGYSLS